MIYKFCGVQQPKDTCTVSITCGPLSTSGGGAGLESGGDVALNLRSDGGKVLATLSQKASLLQFAFQGAPLFQAFTNGRYAVAETRLKITPHDKKAS